MSRPGRAGCTWPSSSTCMRGASSAGGSAVRCARTSFSTRWNKRCTRANRSAMQLDPPLGPRLQGVSIRHSERLAEAGVEPSVGSKGNSYDNALAGLVQGRADSSPRALEDQAGSRAGYAGMGVLVSITIDSSNPSATSLPQKLRQTTTGISPVKQPQWQPDLNQTASTIPGAVHSRCCSGVMVVRVCLMHERAGASTTCVGPNV